MATASHPCPPFDPARRGAGGVASKESYESRSLTRPGCSYTTRSSPRFSVKPPKILNLVYALLFAHLAPHRKCVGYVFPSLCDLILEADNPCGNGNRLTASKARHSSVAF